MSEISKLEQNLIIKKIDNETVNVSVMNNEVLPFYLSITFYQINDKCSQCLEINCIAIIGPLGLS